jgi:hypothetical protein
VRGTLDLADPAPDARFGDEMRHRLPWRSGRRPSPHL